MHGADERLGGGVNTTYAFSLLSLQKFYSQEQGTNVCAGFYQPHHTLLQGADLLEPSMLAMMYVLNGVPPEGDPEVMGVVRLQKWKFQR